MHELTKVRDRRQSPPSHAHLPHGGRTVKQRQRGVLRAQICMCKRTGLSWNMRQTGLQPAGFDVLVR
jgi:hypothetical protein